MRAATICTVPRCPKPAAPGRRGRCTEHSLTRHAMRQRAQHVLERSHGLCSCGALAVAVHHELAVADGGSDELGNLRPRCHACHARQHPHPRRLRPLEVG